MGVVPTPRPGLENAVLLSRFGRVILLSSRYKEWSYEGMSLTLSVANSVGSATNSSFKGTQDTPDDMYNISFEGGGGGGKGAQIQNKSITMDEMAFIVIIG